MAAPLHQMTPSELAAKLTLDRRGVPYLAYRDVTGALRLRTLDTHSAATVGRLESCDVVIDWDAEVSRTHAICERVGGEWSIVDDGLSRNGTFVNGRRIGARHRLAAGDVVRVGQTSLTFVAPSTEVAATAAAAELGSIELSEAQRRVLVALCRPVALASGFAPPASNSEIAGELVISTGGVKAALRVLFDKLGVDELPQNRKRAELARRALELGIVGARDFDDAS